MKLFLLLSSYLILLGCATQRVVSEEDVNVILKPEKDKWMVLCLSPINEFRTSFETEVQKELEFHEVHSQTSHQYIPQPLLQDDETQNKLASLIDSLEDREFSMLLISTLESTEKTKIDADGYFGDFTLYHYITNVYVLENGESTLVWSIYLCLYEYQLPELSVQDFARAIVEKLANDNMIPNTRYETLEFYTLLK